MQTEHGHAKIYRECARELESPTPIPPRVEEPTLRARPANVHPNPCTPPAHLA
jgi:hypothetical protein